MAFIGAKFAMRSQTVNLEAYGLSDDEKQWLSDAVGTSQPQKVQLDKLERDPSLSHEQRRSLRLLQQAIRGELRTGAGSTKVSKDGSAEASADGIIMFKKGAAVSGEPERVQRVREAMPESLWGHEGLVDGFRRLAKDFVSEGRLTPAVMAIDGAVGHGKDQAIAGFKDALFFSDDPKKPSKATVLPLDFASLTNNDYDGIFGGDGPLGAKNLQTLAKTGLCVRIDGADALITRAPKLARGLQTLLLARRGEPNYQHAAWIFNFDAQAAGDDPHTKMAAALGEPGTNCLSATAQFAHLDAKTMERYALATLPRILAAQSLAQMEIEFEEPAEGPAALEMLGQMLATPHAPLDALEARLLRFVLTHLDTQTSLARDQATLLTVRLAETFASHEQERTEMVKALHQPAPRLEQGESVFEVVHVAHAGRNTAARDEIVAMLGEFADNLSAAVMDITLSFEGEDAGLTALCEACEGLERLASKTLPTIKRNAALGRAELLDADTLFLLQVELDVVRGALAALPGTSKASKDKASKAKASEAAENPEALNSRHSLTALLDNWATALEIAGRSDALADALADDLSAAAP